MPALALGWVAGCLATTIGVTAATPYDPTTPSDSPLWWTLTETLTPSELRATLLDRRDHVERYRRAAAAGLVGGLSDESSSRLSFYTNTEHDPQLTPMWRAFEVWCDLSRLLGSDVLIRRMSETGLSRSGVDWLLVVAREYGQERQKLTNSLVADRREFQLLERRLILRGDGDDFRRALRGDRFERAEALTGVPAERLEQLWARWQTNPAARTAVKYLPRVKTRLSAGDWRALRTYLLGEVVPGLGEVVEFVADPENGDRP